MNSRSGEERKKKGENRKIVQAATRTGGAAKVTEPEEEEIIHLVSTITPTLGKDEAAKRRLVNAVSAAWVQKPMRKLVRDLWASVGKSGDMAPAAFASVVERLSAHFGAGVAESSGGIRAESVCSDQAA